MSITVYSLTCVMGILSECRSSGERVVQGDLAKKLLKMAADPSHKHYDTLNAAHDIYVRRLKSPGPDDVYLDVLQSLCESSPNQGAQESQGEAAAGSESNQVANMEISLETTDEEDSGKDSDEDSSDDDSDEDTESDNDAEDKDAEDNAEDNAEDKGAEDVDTYESLTESPSGPLAPNHMPRCSATVKKSQIVSIHPWDSRFWDDESRIIKLSFPKNAKIVSSRREAVTRLYRSGRMYAVLQDGQIAMSPEEDIQTEVDKLNNKRGGHLTVEAWLGFVKKTIVSQQARIKKRKESGGGSSSSAKKRPVVHGPRYFL